jgi:endo-1,4-beta-xylanase
MKVRRLNKTKQLQESREQSTNITTTALNEDGTNRDNVFLRVIGEQYLPIAFRMAAAADPAAKLYYNDYNLEYGTAKHLGALRIVKLVQSWGAKIDGVGLQGHLVSEPTGTQSEVTPSVAVLTKVLQDYANLGVDVAYTELDVRSRTPSNAQKLADAAAAWARVAQSCINVQRCVGMTIWVSFLYPAHNLFDFGDHMLTCWALGYCG